ncbi:MAP/microtubule affinity-regulating kinase [Paragonimus westermani]|uniref:non-specific serine/threonine protein kinase n=1 Tax=Paragonimus westermani TaxID=34504 RepID=A0A5J4NM46_9TREM|nr:MAP/microtubule affinity-regulating kinase [Paragonimus westermani]
MPMEIGATGVVNRTTDYYKASVEQMTALEIVSKTVVEEPNPSQTTSIVENSPNDENVAFKSEAPPESTKTAFVNPPGPSALPTLVAPVQVKNNVGKYRLLRTIGKGNFAKVKLAIHMATGVEVAIKIINKTMMDGTLLKRLKREITIMKITNHPNIGNLNYTTTLPLREIFDYLVANGKMREKEARVKFRQLLSAIQYCHSKRIVHRDLKAENILLDGNLSVKVADFGLANTFAPDQRLNTFCGSPPYAAPELFLGIPYYGPGVDVWSLGVILFTLVLGHLPFDARDLRELRSKIIGLHYSIPKNSISLECEALLRKMLVLDPKDRSSLKVLMQDKWVNMGYAPSDFLRPHKECSRSQLDEVRVEAMEAMGFTRADLESSVVNPEFDHVYATYHLLPETPSQFVVLYDQVPPTPTTQTQTAVTLPNNLMTSQTNAVQIRPNTESAQQQPVAIGRFTVAPSGAISVDSPSKPVHDSDHVGQVTTSHRSNIAGPESAVREHHSLTSSLPVALKRAFAQMGRTFGAGGGANSSIVSGQHIEANSRTFTQTTNCMFAVSPW